MQSQVDTQTPPESREERPRVVIQYQAGHTSRYNVLNSTAFPPRLTRVRRLLSKLARDHRVFPGVVINTGSLNDRISNEIDERRGPADELVRALENVGILVSAKYGPDAKSVYLYDDERMRLALEFNSGAGPALPLLDAKQVVTRMEQLLAQAAQEDESPPESGEIHLPANGNAALDLTDVILTLDTHKRSIPLEGGQLRDVVIHPITVLMKAFPDCGQVRAERIVDEAIRAGYLTVLDKDVFRLNLEPVAPNTAPTSSETKAVATLVADELKGLEVQLGLAQRRLDDEIERQQVRRQAEIERLHGDHERATVTTLGDKRREAERALDRTRREIDGRRDERLGRLKTWYEKRKGQIEAEFADKLRDAADQLGMETERQLQILKADASQSLELSEQGKAVELTERDQSERRPFQEMIELLELRIAGLNQYLELRKRPIRIT